jgi:hypothetical protein
MCSAPAKDIPPWIGRNTNTYRRIMTPLTMELIMERNTSRTSNVCMIR